MAINTGLKELTTDPKGIGSIVEEGSRSEFASAKVTTFRGRIGKLALQAAILLALAGVTAVLVGLPWIIPSLFPLAWLGMGLLAFVASQQRPAPAFVYSYLAGTGALAIAFHWAIQAISEQIGISWTHACAIFAGLVIWEGLQMGLFGLMVAWVVGKDLSRAWAIPFLWIVPEFWWPKIFPWSMAHLHTDHPLLLQSAEWGGVASVSFLFMVAAAITTVSLGLLVSRYRSSTRPIIRWRSQLAAGFSLLTLLLLGGWLRQTHIQGVADRGQHFTVAAIQIDPTYVGWIDKLRERSREVEAEADLVCWPESSTGTYDESLKHFRDVSHTIRHSVMPNPAKTLLPRAKCHVLAGAKTYEPGSKDEGPYRNAALLVAPNQDIVGRYIKRALMPIGEYMPGEQFYPELREMANIHKDILPGKNASPVIVPGVAKPGVLICYEDLVTWTARSTVSQGADCLIALINASAFDNPITLDQHYRLAMLRSVENRRALIRCSATGVTSVVSPVGELLNAAPPLSESTLLQTVPRMKGRTFYNRFGDLFAYLCTTSVAGLIVERLTRRWPVA